MDRLYRVADLLTDRPSPKPPDLCPEEELESRPLLPSPLPAPALWAVVGSLTWTKKWTFEHFVKKKRRKVVSATFLQHGLEVVLDLLSSCRAEPWLLLLSYRLQSVWVLGNI